MANRHPSVGELAVFVLLLSSAASGTAHACDQPLAGSIPKTAQNEAVQQLSRELAELYLPTAITLQSSEATARSEFRAGFDAEQGSKALREKEPALVQQLENAVAKSIRQCLEQRLPDIHIQLGNFFQDTFTAPELREIVAFYQSGGGQAIQEIASRSAKAPDDIITANGQVRDLTETDMRSMMQAVDFTKLDVKQRLSALVFFRSPTGQKFAARGELMQILATGINGINAQSIPNMQKAMDEAFVAWQRQNPSTETNTATTP